jgi:manganese-dependent inorganic pyrophosphatase
MVFFMLTNIIRESTELLSVGSQAKALIEGAFNVKQTNDGFVLEGVVSRKKQLIPALVAAIQE